jgi:hypothetical protein
LARDIVKASAGRILARSSGRRWLVALDKAPRNPGTVAEIVSDFTNFRTGKEPFDPATASHCEIFALRNSFDSSEFERQGTTQGETQWQKTTMRLAEDRSAHPAETWVLYFRTTRNGRRQTGGEQAHHWLVRDLPDKRTAWAKVERLHLPINPIDLRRGVTFAHLALHYSGHELVEHSESIHPKAHTTIKGYERVLRNRLPPDWGTRIALGIEPLEIED